MPHPLNHGAVTRPYTFNDGISIREISAILWEISIVKAYISAHDRDDLASTRYWLCASKEVEHVHGEVGDDLYAKATYAMWALQIICPSGAKNVFLKFAHTERGYDNVGSKQPKQLCRTRMGGLRLAEGPWSLPGF